MNALAFLGLALAISVLGFAVLWLVHRPPRSIEAHMKEFRDQIEALAPETKFPPEGRGRRNGRRTSESGRRSG